MSSEKLIMSKPCSSKTLKMWLLSVGVISILCYLITPLNSSNERHPSLLASAPFMAFSKKRKPLVPLDAKRFFILKMIDYTYLTLSEATYFGSDFLETDRLSS
jgi:hypothetical protein